MPKITTAEDLKNFPEADLVVNYIVDRWKKGLYTLVLVGGLPGSGKSSTCCRLAELVQKELMGENNFTADNIADNFLDLIKVVKNAKPDKLCTQVIEEVSVLFPSRRAMSSDNVDINKVLDTCRKKKLILFANAPVWPSIDSHMRSMANVYIQTIRVYKMAGLVYSKCYKIQTNPTTGKTYTHNFKRKNKDVNRMYTLMPSKETWEAYESKKDTFLDELYAKAEARAIKKQDKENKLIHGSKMKNVSPRDMQIYARKEKGDPDVEIGKEFGVSDRRVRQIYKEITKNIENTRENR